MRTVLPFFTSNQKWGKVNPSGIPSRGAAVTSSRGWWVLTCSSEPFQTQWQCIPWRSRAWPACCRFFQTPSIISAQISTGKVQSEPWRSPCPEEIRMHRAFFFFNRWFFNWSLPRVCHPCAVYCAPTSACEPAVLFWGSSCRVLPWAEHQGGTEPRAPPPTSDTPRKLLPGAARGGRRGAGEPRVPKAPLGAPRGSSPTCVPAWHLHHFSQEKMFVFKGNKQTKTRKQQPPAFKTTERTVGLLG